MKKNFRKLSALLLTLVFSMSAFTTAFAANLDYTIKYNDKDTTQEVGPGSAYTDTDLFANFKGVMPGDMLTESITIKNTYTGSDGINLYMDAKLHDEADSKESASNPVSDNVLNELEGESYQEKVANMNDFLHQLTLTVEMNDTVIYKGHPDELKDGFEDVTQKDDFYYSAFLGVLPQGNSVTLDVTLEVPFEMEDDYANCIGEVDWIFIIEAYNKGGGGGGNDDPDPKPDPDPSNPSDDPEEEPPLVLGDEDIKDPEEPPLVLGDEDVIEITDAPKTGDDTVILPYIALFAVGLIGTILTAVKKRKAKEE